MQTQTLFTRAVGEIKLGRPPRRQHALEVGQSFLSKVCPADLRRKQTLTAFLGGILTKRFTNPSSDIFEILAGLDEADKVISDLVNGLDEIIRNGDTRKYLSHIVSGHCLTSLVSLRESAIQTALSMTSGAYQTGLVSYLTHRDLFPALMKVRPRSAYFLCL